jgi:hypothetical protein
MRREESSYYLRMTSHRKRRGVADGAAAVLAAAAAVALMAVPSAPSRAIMMAASRTGALMSPMRLASEDSAGLGAAPDGACGPYSPAIAGVAGRDQGFRHRRFPNMARPAAGTVTGRLAAGQAFCVMAGGPREDMA